MLVGCFMFSLNDTAGKWLVATYPVGELLLIRSAVALALMSSFAVTFYQVSTATLHDQYTKLNVFSGDAKAGATRPRPGTATPSSGAS